MTVTSLTPDQAREIVYQRFRTQWLTTTPVTYEGEAERTLDQGTVAWVRVSMRHLDGGQDTLGPAGSRIFRRVARVSIQIFVPKGTGMQAGALLSQTARAIFEGTTLSGLSFGNGQVREIGPDGKWYQHLVELALDYDELK